MAGVGRPLMRKLLLSVNVHGPVVGWHVRDRVRQRLVLADACGWGRQHDHAHGAARGSVRERQKKSLPIGRRHANKRLGPILQTFFQKPHTQHATSPDALTCWHALDPLATEAVVRLVV